MDDCNESESQSGVQAAAAEASARAAADGASAPSKTSETGLIEVAAPTIAENDSLAATSIDDRAKVAGLGTLVPKEAIEPVDGGSPAPSQPAPAVAAPPSSDEETPGRRKKYAILAASLITAAGLGALAGVFAAFAVGVSAPAPAQVPVAYSAQPATQSPTADTQSLKATVAQLRADVSALKSSIESANEAANGQFTKMAERFDRIERAQAEPAARIGKAVDALERLERRADTGVSKETTGSVPTGPAAAPATVPAPPAAASAAAPTPASAPIPGWAVRDVYRGVALVQSPRFGLIEVEAGDVIPGIGRVESIRKQDGHWVVATSRGIIASR